MDTGMIVKPIDKILFFDIETVPCSKDFDTMFDTNWRLQTEWVSRQRQDNKLEMFDARDGYKEKAALYPEFGKIVAISFGYLRRGDGTGYDYNYIAKDLVGDDEKALLTSANGMMAAYLKAGWSLAGHNSNLFDKPYIAKRSFYNGVYSPLFEYVHKKPWEITDIDTIELFKFGGRDWLPLSLITALLNIPSPKSEMSGKDVADVFYSSDDQARFYKIAKYCAGDTMTVAKIIAIMKNINLININLINESISTVDVFIKPKN